MPDDYHGARDHIFISYAWEDSALAEWLALKLTAEGYAVWIDRLKLLGGEPYPKDIDDAIKHRTFRLLALLSRFSLAKPNPRKERTLALNLARERSEDFLIPLNVDGLRPTELDWMTNDLTFIPCHESWAEGYAQLLKKLASLDAPKPVQNGGEIAASVFLSKDIVLFQPERLWSNLFRIERIPPVIRCYELARTVERDEERRIAERWAFRKVDEKRLLSFRSPVVSSLDASLLVESEPALWKEMDTIHGIRSTDLVSELLKKSLERKCIERGLVWAEGTWVLYFPKDLLPKDQIVLSRYKHGLPGYKRGPPRVQVTGVRKFYPSKFRYHLSPAFTIRRGLTAEFEVQLRVRAYLTDLEGKSLKSEMIGPRRRRLGRGWWNREWLLRHLAIAAHLADGQPSITIGEEEEMVSVAAYPLQYDAPVRINEKALRPPKPAAETEGEVEIAT